MAPTMVGAPEIAIGGVKRLPGPNLVARSKRDPVTTSDLRCVHVIAAAVLTGENMDDYFVAGVGRR